MLLNLGPQNVHEEQRRMKPGMWIGPSILAAVLGMELAWIFSKGTLAVTTGTRVGPREVGLTLFGPYLLGVEIASMLLLAGLVGAYHLGRREQPERGAK
jgi:NADH-quinone oxidoreductase subunit J